MTSIRAPGTTGTAGARPTAEPLTGARAGAQPGAQPGARQAWLWGLAAWGLLRVVASTAAWASLHWLAQGDTIPVPGYTPPHLTGAAAVLAGSWLRADALWYLHIAAHGYGGDPRTFAFLPAFPLLTRLITPLVGGDGLFAGLLVANAACLLGLVWLYRVVQALIGSPAARATVVGLALFPTAFFLVAPYGEPVLLAAGAGALLAQIRGRPYLAALAGAVAALSRPFGVLIALPMAALALPMAALALPMATLALPGIHGPGGRGTGRGRWLAPLGPVAGAAGWFAWVGSQAKDPLGAVRVQAVWQRSLHLPWATLVGGVQGWLTWRRTSYGPYFLLDVVATAFALALIVATLFAFRRAREAGEAGLAAPGTPVAWAFAAFGALALLAPLSTPYLPRPLMSVPRFVLAMFPVFVGYALVPPRWRIPLAALSASGLGVATAVFVAARPIF